MSPSIEVSTKRVNAEKGLFSQSDASHLQHARPGATCAHYRSLSTLRYCCGIPRITASTHLGSPQSQWSFAARRAFFKQTLRSPELLHSPTAYFVRNQLFLRSNLEVEERLLTSASLCIQLQIWKWKLLSAQSKQLIQHPTGSQRPKAATMSATETVPQPPGIPRSPCRRHHCHEKEALLSRAKSLMLNE